jgi:hypothetical protein
MEWQPMEQQDTCRYVFETPHPYAPSYEKYQVIHFPEAEYIKISFSNDCDTEFGYDFVSFFKGSLCLHFVLKTVCSRCCYGAWLLFRRVLHGVLGPREVQWEISVAWVVGTEAACVPNEPFGGVLSIVTCCRAEHRMGGETRGRSPRVAPSY